MNPNEVADLVARRLRGEWLVGEAVWVDGVAGVVLFEVEKGKQYWIRLVYSPSGAYHRAVDSARLSAR